MERLPLILIGNFQAGSQNKVIHLFQTSSCYSYDHFQYFVIGFMSFDQVGTVHKLRTHKVRHEEIYEDTNFIHKQGREMLQIAIRFRMNDDISVDTNSTLVFTLSCVTSRNIKADQVKKFKLLKYNLYPT